MLTGPVGLELCHWQDRACALTSAVRARSLFVKIAPGARKELARVSDSPQSWGSWARRIVRSKCRRPYSGSRHVGDQRGSDAGVCLTV